MTPWTSWRRTALAARPVPLLTGVLAQQSLNGVADGLLFGNPGQVVTQVIAVAAVVVYSGVMSFILLKVIGLVIPLRAGESEENTGLDINQHGEEAYLHVGGTSSSDQMG